MNDEEKKNGRDGNLKVTKKEPVDGDRPTSKDAHFDVKLHWEDKVLTVRIPANNTGLLVVAIVRALAREEIITSEHLYNEVADIIPPESLYVKMSEEEDGDNGDGDVRA